MVEFDPHYTEPDARPVEADPKRPWKAYVAAGIAVAITVVQVVMNAYADDAWSREDTFVTILAFLGALAVYFQPNPIVAKSPLRRNEVGVTSLTVVILVAAAVAVLCVLVVIPALR